MEKRKIKIKLTTIFIIILIAILICALCGYICKDKIKTTIANVQNNIKYQDIDDNPDKDFFEYFKNNMGTYNIDDLLTICE